jgi:hypothetical protein
VDVVVPFVGTDEELAELRTMLRTLDLTPRDTVTIVDNRPGAQDADPDDCVLAAPGVASSYYARNRGSRRGRSPWIVFLDADVLLEPGLLSAYFDPLPEVDTGQLIGAIEPFAAGDGRVERYGVIRRHLSQEEVGERGAEVGLTANVAVRREAFESIGGFADRIRSGGDADLSFRLRDAGWAIETRPAARVHHPTRTQLGTMLRVFMRYGSGAEWIRRRHPHFSPPVPVWRVTLWIASAAVRIPLAAVRRRDDEVVVRALDLAVGLAFEAGRFVPNERDVGPRARLEHVRRTVGRRLRRRPRTTQDG